jgi:hypothetical protein
MRLRDFLAAELVWRRAGAGLFERLRSGFNIPLMEKVR